MPVGIYSQKYSRAAANFFLFYTEENFLHCPRTKFTNLKHKSLRVCRFCKNKFGKVTFKHEAHIIPVALGNKYLISDFECDKCNSIFGKYENDLMNFIGINRTISKTQGRKKVPKFSSKELRAYKKDFFHNKDAIKLEFSKDNPFHYDKKTKQRTISYTKAPFVPINVYKALLKIALCSISDADVSKYYIAFDFLLNKDIDDKIIQLPLFGYGIPYPGYPDVFGTLYRKIYKNANVTSHSFVLYYGIYMFQIFLPFHSSDYSFYSSTYFPIIPPVFDGSGNEKWEHQFKISANLASTVPRSDTETITFNEDAEQKETVCIDPVTKTILNKKIIPSDIVGMYIVDDNFMLNLDDFNKINSDPSDL